MSKLLESIMLFLKGACLGIANAIPGVDTGTIAFVLKIYDRLLDAIDINVKKLIKNLPFLVPVGAGALIGIFAASKVLGYLSDNHNVIMQFFVIGLIIGSLPGIVRECRSSGKLSPIHIIPFALGLIGILAFNSLDIAGRQGTPGPAAIIIATAIAATSMILPGLSGALLLKLFGAYDHAIHAISNLDFSTIILYAIGAVIGLLASAKVISYLLSKYKTGTYCAIIGMIIGSVPAVYPDGFALDTTGIIAVILLIVGIAIPLLMEVIEKKLSQKRPNEPDSTNG